MDGKMTSTRAIKRNMIQARFFKKGNRKLGYDMWSFSKLKGDDYYNTCYGCIKGSCGIYCKGCDKTCYVNKSYNIYPSVIKGHARNTLAFRMDIEKAFTDLNGFIDRAKKKPDFIRINQSGEIESTSELKGWIYSAIMHKTIKYYLYTKNFDVLRSVLNTDVLPDNITILVSVWHEYGIKEYNEFKHLKNIKAFVYDDGFDYKAYGLNIETYCHAYDKNGKLNHDVTCDVCRKCIDRTCKVIGCYEH